MLARDKIKQQFLKMGYAIVIIVLLITAYYLVMRGTAKLADMALNVDRVFCPCGKSCVAAYKFCSECGTTALDAEYVTYPHCADCGSWANHGTYCVKCGSDNIEEPLHGKVRDLPFLSRLPYQ